MVIEETTEVQYLIQLSKLYRKLYDREERLKALKIEIETLKKEYLDLLNSRKVKLH